MKRHKQVNMGSVSCATMRTEDLIPAFLSALGSQRPLQRAHRNLISDIEASIEANSAGDCSATYDLEQLSDALDAYSPAYFYFGAHSGDGADYGWWLSEEWEQQLVDDGGIEVSDLADVPVDHVGNVAVVNDHGNITLYRRGRNHRLYEVWSVV